MGIQTENSLKIVVVALFVALTFAVAGLVAVTPLTGSSVVAQNDTGGNETGTGNETSFYTQTRQAWLPRLNANLTKLLFLTTFDKTGMDRLLYILSSTNS